MTSNRRRVALAAASLAFAMAVAGCGAGTNAETSKIKAPADGVEASAGAVRLLDTLIVVPAATSAPTGPSEGQLLVTVANTGVQDDQLTAITAGGATLDGFQPAAVPAGGVLRVGQGEGRVDVAVRAITGAAGGSVPLTFAFQRSGSVTLRVPLVAATGPYASLTPPSPSPS